MPEIECPSKGGDTNNCDWIKREGFVRDFPKTGVIECKSCSLVMHSNDLSSEVNYTQSTMHNWQNDYVQSLDGPSDDVIRRVAAVQNLEREYKFRSILDFGCGSGEMLEAFSKYWDILGIEPDPKAREIAEEKGLSDFVFESAESVLSEGITVDVVTLFHVIEHFYQPTLELEKIQSLLKPGGLLIIETPNSNDALLVLYENEAFQNFNYWSHHPMLHSKNSLNAVISRNSFRVLQNQGIQRYDLNNHLYWLSKGAPNGHNIWRNILSADTIDRYARDLY